MSKDGSRFYVYLIALVAALGGLLFGYDTAVVSGAIGFMRTRFDMSSVMMGWAASCALVGCVVGALFAGALSDRIGRKKVLVISAILFFVSAVGAAIPRTLIEFIIARLLGGIGIGAASMLSPLYIAEVSPANIRGRLVSINQFAIVAGMLVVYFVNAVIANMGDQSWNVSMGWRWMFGSGAFPALAFFILLFFVPESPRWLIENGESEQAKAVLSKVAGAAHAEKEMLEIKEAISHEQSTIGQLFQGGGRIALLIGIGLAIFQQITGINIVLYYAPEIFKSAGLGSGVAISETVVVGLVNLCFTLVAIAVVDKIGRKPLLIIASAGMGVSLFLLGGAFFYQKFEGPWVLIFVLGYVASFAVAMGPVVWVVISEIFPTLIRGRAMSIAIVCLWISCFLVSQFFPAMLEALGGGWVFSIYGTICLVSLLFVARFVPETKGKTLEEIERFWAK